MPDKVPRMLSLIRGDTVLGTIEVNPGEADFPSYTAGEILIHINGAEAWWRE